MIFCRFEVSQEVGWGFIEEHLIHEIESPFEDLQTTGRQFALKDVKLKAPVLPTSKIIGVGLNYQAHIEEFGRTLTPDEPVIFLKAPSSVIGLDEAIVLPQGIGPVEYEAELGVVISQPLKNVSEEKALEGILGCTCVNDVTARVLQKKDGQWARAKSFDTFAPIGPWVVQDLPYQNLRVEAYRNGQVVQEGHTKHMIFTVPKLVSFLSHVMTLYPGDIITTGTPKGVGLLTPGDVIEIFVEGVGKLRNHVVSENSQGVLHELQ